MELYFLVFVALYALQVIAVNYYDTAHSLDGTIVHIRVLINEIKDTVNTNLPQVNNSDLNIKSESRIAAVQKQLDQKAGRKGINVCKKRLEDALIPILDDAHRIVEHRLNNVLQSLDNFNAVLDPIKSRLNGTALDSEVGACNKDPKTCKLTGQYSELISSTDNAVFSIYKEMSEPLILVLDKNLSNKIDNNLVKPVTACLATV